MGEIRKWFSERTIFAPFGRYEGTRRSDEPANQVLIGREKQRSRLLNLLFTAGKTGAFLVTGQRGSGKTSFVRYCLDEYRENVFRRWLATNVGRPFFWDRVGNLLLVGILPILGLLLISELTQATLVGEELRFIELMIVVSLSFVGLFPLLAAHRCVALAMRGLMISYDQARSDPIGDWPRSKPWPILATALVALFLLLLPGGNTPLLFLGKLLLLSGALALCGSALALSQHRRSQRWNREKALYGVKLGKLGMTLPQLLSLLPFLLILLITTPPKPLEAAGIRSHLYFYIAATLLCLGLSFLADLSHRALIRSRLEEEEARKTYGDFGGSILIWNGVSGTLFVLLGAFFCYRFFAQGPWAHLTTAGMSALPSSMRWLVPWVFLLAVPATLWRSNFRRFSHQVKRGQELPPLQNNPPISLLLGLKALGFLVLGLQLSFPLIAFLAQRLDAISKIPLELRSLCENYLFWSDTSLAAGLGLQGAESLDLFQNLSTDLLWIGSGTNFMVILGTLEFIWIVRAVNHGIEDSSLHRPPILPRGRQVHSETENYTIARSRYLRDLSRSTFFFGIFDAWLPVLVVNVNLGFDDLQYRRVVEAMLAGLRGAYYETFLHWRRPFVAAKKIIVAGLLLFCTFKVGDFIFDASRSATDTSANDSLKSATYCSWAQQNLQLDQRPVGEAYSPTPKALWLTCRVGGEGLLQALQWRPLHSDDNSVTLSRPVAGASTETSLSSQSSVSSESFPETSTDRNLLLFLFENTSHPFLQLRVYHLLTLLILWFIFRTLSRHLPIGLHRETYRKMSELHEHLSASVREELPPEVAGPVSVFNAFFRRKVRHKSMDPFDPRTVEVQFQRTLEELQERDARLPFAPNHRVSLPTPDIIFVFDELDKIGVGRVVKPLGPDTAARDNEAPMTQGRERAQRLHKLFGDLKNLLSCANARFIFLGARNLHDETLADYADRNPLLSNIFDEDIYLPSLLGDSSFYRRQQVEDPEFSARVRREIADETERKDYSLLPREDHYLVPPGIDFFLTQNQWRCQLLYTSYHRKYARSWLAPWEEVRQSPAYVRSGATWFEGQMKQGEEDSPLQLLSVDPPEALNGSRSYQFRHDFLQFLAYRSLGNVKRLRSLMESFLEPKGRVLNPSNPNPGAHYDHVLAFSDLARYRIQLIAAIYRELMPVFEDRISGGDDKLVSEILYLSDFVLKFHRRGFTWSNLGRLDELVHIHRAPELRRIMEQMVVAWSNRFLHPIRNGMYDYRFESSFAREIIYISERSERELAAFNFTLDESQALKAIFQARLENLSEEASYEFIAGLGELHEFDEEFEMARYHYRHAIQLLDQKYHGSVAAVAETPAIFEALKISKGGIEGIRLRVSWGVARVRLLLQIAMSFEQSHDLEQAQVEYRNALTLSMAVIHSLAHPATNLSTKTGELGSTLKHLNLLFQPAFAEAWIWEKLASGVDTAPTLVEGTLDMLREVLTPFIHPSNLAEIEPATGPNEIQQANFSLVLAELHDKAGDLYFFKGRGLPAPATPQQENGGPLESPHGYLQRAYYHYAMALQEVRRFNVYRRKSSGRKFSVSNDENPSPTFHRNSWPDFPLRAAAGAFADLGECALARLPFWRMLRDGGNGTARGVSSLTVEKLEDYRREVFEALDGWLESNPEPWGKVTSEPILLCRLGIAQPGHYLGSLLGRWKSIKRKRPSWRILEELGISFEGSNPKVSGSSLRDLLDAQEDQKIYELRIGGYPTPKDTVPYLTFFSWSLACSLYSAELMDRAGYQEASAREHLRVAHTITCYLWWFRAVRVLAPPDPGNTPWKEQSLRQHLFKGISTKIDLSDPSLGNLFRHAVISLEAAARAFSRRRPWTWSGGQRPRVEAGVQVPPELITQVCWLALLLDGLPSIQKEDGSQLSPADFSKERERLKAILVKLWPKWTEEFLSGSGGGSEPPPIFKAALRENIARHSFPIRDRILGLHVLIGQGALAPLRGCQESLEDSEDRWKETGDHVIEFLKLKKHYSSSLYFTPTQSGIALAVLGLRLIEDKKNRYLDGSLHPVEKTGISLNSILRVARQDLQLAQEMQSMKRGYYEAISGLYYLYDDFNDRTIHYNLSLQMSGSELAAVLLQLVEEELKGQFLARNEAAKAVTERP